MKIKSIKFSGDKQYLHFDDKTIICTPEYYDFEVGMKLDLKFDGVTLDRNNEIITIFVLSNNEVNFNLYINDGTRYGDDANLLSTFVKIKELPKISPIHFLVKDLDLGIDSGSVLKKGYTNNVEQYYNDKSILNDIDLLDFKYFSNNREYVGWLGYDRTKEKLNKLFNKKNIKYRWFSDKFKITLDK